MSHLAWGLAERVILVVGATGGIGQALTARLAADGARLALTGTDPARAQALAAPYAAQAAGFGVDVTDPDSVERLFAAVRERFGRLDGLVNLAGTNIRRSALEASEADWRRIVEINLFGAFRVARAAARIMVDQGGGRIVTISSIRGRFGFRGGYSAYTASKGGVDMLTRQLATEWAPYRVTVNAVAPGFVETPLIQKLLDNPDLYRRISDRVPMGRLARPDDIVGPVLFFLSDAAAFVTGQILYVDGGTTAVEL